MKVSASVLFVVFVSAAVGTPVKLRGSRSTTLEHPFDLGPLTTCVQPPNTTVCPFIDYPIPAVLASSINSRIIPIESALDYVSSHSDEACQNSFRRELCNLYLPRCTEESDGTQSVRLHFNCTRVLADCPSDKHDDFQKYCPEVGQLTGTYPLENCKPSSEQDRIVSNHSLCDDYVDAAMPKWLQAHAKVYGNNLKVVYEVLEDNDAEDCLPNWLNVSCQSFGRCWAQGERMEHPHSKEQCQSVESWWVKLLIRANLHHTHFVFSSSIQPFITSLQRNSVLKFSL